MENPIRVCTIDGISYPIIHGEFIDATLPHIACGICKYAICAKCADLFSFNHECKYKYYHDYFLKNRVCKPCDKKRNKELIEILQK